MAHKDGVVGEMCKMKNLTTSWGSEPNDAIRQVRESIAEAQRQIGYLPDPSPDIIVITDRVEQAIKKANANLVDSRISEKGVESLVSISGAKFQDFATLFGFPYEVYPSAKEVERRVFELTTEGKKVVFCL